MEHRASPALTDAGLAALRRAAVMAHTVGAIHLRLSAGGSRIVEVRPDPERPAAPPLPYAPVVDPCRFRIAVARAWADHLAGREIGLLGLGAADELDIAWSVAPPGEELGFGAVRAPCGGRMVWAFASLLDPGSLTAVIGELHPPSAGSPDCSTHGLAAHLVHDELLGATVVHVESEPPGYSTRRVLDEVLRRMVAAVTAAELVDSLG